MPHLLSTLNYFPQANAFQNKCQSGLRKFFQLRCGSASFPDTSSEKMSCSGTKKICGSDYAKDSCANAEASAQAFGQVCSGLTGFYSNRFSNCERIFPQQ